MRNAGACEADPPRRVGVGVDDSPGGPTALRWPVSQAWAGGDLLVVGQERSPRDTR
jgi:hypothetical protein